MLYGPALKATTPFGQQLVEMFRQPKDIFASVKYIEFYLQDVICQRLGRWIPSTRRDIDAMLDWDSPSKIIACDPFSVITLGDFWKFLATNLLTKVAQKRLATCGLI